jgi:hypothetical protein
MQTKEHAGMLDPGLTRLCVLGLKGFVWRELSFEDIWAFSGRVKFP